MYNITDSSQKVNQQQPRVSEPRAYSYIRFSTPEQEKGDSYRRQLQAAEEFAKTHGFILDNTINLADRGLSAYTGEHRKKGGLGTFLKLVENGDIPPGSLLIVESFDRLSRENVDVALEVFIELRKADIWIGTPPDQQIYKPGDDWTKLFRIIAEMGRAHEESRLKSERIKAAWANKRKRASKGEVKLTSKCPAWLKLENMEFQVIPERAQVIKQVFEMKLSGIGIRTIEKRLNQQDGWKPDKGWRHSYLNKILRSRAVVGEYQPCKMVDGKQQPDGEPLIDYFPSVVEKEKFDRVQEIFRYNKENYKNAGGRTGKISNLFSYIAVCSFCGNPMSYLSKGPKPKGGEYLLCDNARRGLECNRVYLRYDHFEPLILKFCKGLDASAILPGNAKRQSELSVLRNQLQAVDGELFQLERQKDNILDNIADIDNKELRKALIDKANNILQEKTELEKQSKEIKDRINTLASASQDTAKQLKNIAELMEHMEQAEGQERIEVRTSLREQLRRLIKKIKVNPIKGYFAIFFQTGERRLITLEDGLIFDAYPKR